VDSKRTKNISINVITEERDLLAKHTGKKGRALASFLRECYLRDLERESPHIVAEIRQMNEVYLAEKHQNRLAGWQKRRERQGVQASNKADDVAASALQGLKNPLKQ
jgi:hypothetical protein